MIKRSVGHRDRCVQTLHLRHVLGLAFVVLLAVGLPHLGMGLHDDPRLGSINLCLPRALCAHHLAVLVLLGVLPEVPDAAFLVLGEPVVGPFDELALFPSLVVDHDALHAHYLLGLVSDGELVALLASLVEEGGARLHWEVLIVYLGGELGRVDVGSVSLVLLRLVLLRRGASAPRREHEHRSHERPQYHFASNQLHPSFPKGRHRRVWSLSVCVHIEGWIAELSLCRLVVLCPDSEKSLKIHPSAWKVYPANYFAWDAFSAILSECSQIQQP